MTDRPPPPLVAPDVDLRDFQFMPLDVVRLRDSDLASRVTGEEFRAAVMLWCASWHQKPAASLPDDDVILSSLAGFGRVVKEWEAVKQGAIRGWIKCSDGRLYHTVVAEKANEAWLQKQVFAWRRECDRIRKENIARAKTGLAPLPFPPKPAANETESVEIPLEPDDTSAGIPAENALKGPDQTRPDLNISARERRAREFDDFWEAWPNHVRRGAAKAAFDRSDGKIEDILLGVRRYIASRSPDQQWPDPAKWLDDRRWLDEPAPRAAKGGVGHATADAKRNRPGEFYHLQQTAQGVAWEAHRRRSGAKQLWDARGGWSFPSEWPPSVDPPTNVVELSRTGASK